MTKKGLLTLKYGDPGNWSWGPRLRDKAGYLTPDDIYELAVCDLVHPDTDWLDVGCGRDLFSQNPKTAKILAARCRSLTGLDPSANIFENPLLQHRHQGTMQEFSPGYRYDLITLRMVAEHVTDPKDAVEALAHLTRPGGRVVIYTVNKWSPASLVAAMTPMAVHHAVKHVLWKAEERDTFPTAYKMNTRSTLKRLFQTAGFREESFRYLDDTRIFHRFKWLNIIELAAWRALKWIGLRYPENCLFGIYVYGVAAQPRSGGQPMEAASDLAARDDRPPSAPRQDERASDGQHLRAPLTASPTR